MRAIEHMVGLQSDLGHVPVARCPGYDAEILTLLWFDDLILFSVDQQKWDHYPCDMLVDPRARRLGSCQRPPCSQCVEFGVFRQACWAMRIVDYDRFVVRPSSVTNRLLGASFIAAAYRTAIAAPSPCPASTVVANPVAWR